MRSDYLFNMINRISEFGISKIYIYFDGTKNQEDKIYQNDLISKIEKHCESLNIILIIRRSDINLGISKSVINAADWFFLHEEYGVLLEDDLIISNEFLKFTFSARNLLELHSEILLVSGNQFFSGEYALRWTHYPLIWGWATTRQKWLIIRKLVLDRSMLRFKNFNFINFAFWVTGVLRVKWGIVDSWAIPFAARMKSLNYVSLLPSVNLVSHVGLDSQAVHATQKDLKFIVPISSEPVNVPMRDNMIHSIANIMDFKLEDFLYRVSMRNLLSPFRAFIEITLRKCQDFVKR